MIIICKLKDKISKKLEKYVSISLIDKKYNNINGKEFNTEFLNFLKLFAIKIYPQN